MLIHSCALTVILLQRLQQLRPALAVDLAKEFVELIRHLNRSSSHRSRSICLLNFFLPRISCLLLLRFLLRFFERLLQFSQFSKGAGVCWLLVFASSEERRVGKKCV